MTRISTSATPITHSDCGRIAAPSTRMGASPEKEASWWNSLPHTTSASPRRKMEAPMVMMMSVTTEALRALSMANLASSTPPSMAAAQPIRIASGSGRPAAVSVAALMPPIMMNSPWAKLMTVLAL